MSDLQLALVFLAAAVLLAVYLHGRWQERRTLRAIGERMRQGVGDALELPLDVPLDGPVDGPARPPLDAPVDRSGPQAARERVEPRLGRVGTLPAGELVRALGDDEPDTPAAARLAGARGVPALRSGPRPATGVEPEAPPRGGWVEDPLLDFVIELRCAHAVDGVAVIDAGSALARVGGGLPVFLVAWDARIQQWVPPDRFGFYADLLAATQLAHRRHVLGPVEASRFLAAVQQVALGLEADFDPPDLDAVVAQATALDRRLAPFDVQLGLTLEAESGPWEGRRLDEAARAAGLSSVGPMRWERRDAEGRVLFALVGASLLSDRLSLELDVPLAPAAARPLATMLATAQQLAPALGARVVDDNHRPLEAASLAAIESQLARLYDEMRAAGIEPGGTRALRLFGADAAGPGGSGA